MDSITADNYDTLDSFYAFKAFKETDCENVYPLHKLIKLYNKFIHKKLQTNQLNFTMDMLIGKWKEYYKQYGEFLKARDDGNKEAVEPEPHDIEVGWLIFWLYERAPDDILCYFPINDLVERFCKFHHIPEIYKSDIEEMMLFCKENP